MFLCHPSGCAPLEPCPLPSLRLRPTIIHTKLLSLWHPVASEWAGFLWLAAPLEEAPVLPGSPPHPHVPPAAYSLPSAPHKAGPGICIRSVGFGPLYHDSPCLIHFKNLTRACSPFVMEDPTRPAQPSSWPPTVQDRQRTLIQDPNAGHWPWFPTKLLHPSWCVQNTPDPSPW